MMQNAAATVRISGTTAAFCTVSFPDASTNGLGIQKNESKTITGGYTENLVLNSREDFDFSKNLLKFPDSLTDVERASCFYQVIKFSYGAGGKTYGGNPVKIKKSFPLIRACSERLEDVVIENRDFQKLIEQYDREQALFFCDPPYFGTENYYDNVDFLRENHYRLKIPSMQFVASFFLRIMTAHS